MGKHLFYTFFVLLLTIHGQSQDKLKGMSFEGPSQKTEIDEFQDIQKTNSNWVSLMPYAYAQGSDPNINYENLSWQWWGEGYEGTKQCIRDAHNSGLKVMVKPHLWIRHGSFTGDVKFDSEEDWNIWETDYLNYVLKYAQLCEEEKVELFCIGTELKSWFLARPDSWEVMIQEIKKVYKGKLTYAGNWDAYKLFPFWDQLDYIGIDAYFPLSSSTTPTVDELNAEWSKWKKEIKGISKRFNKEVIFTEYGYRNIDQAAEKPWESYTAKTQNDVAQANAYTSLYESVWNEPWMYGGFAWKWHCSSHLKSVRKANYTPQGKIALKVLIEYYSQ